MIDPTAVIAGGIYTGAIAIAWYIPDIIDRIIKWVESL